MYMYIYRDKKLLESDRDEELRQTSLRTYYLMMMIIHLNIVRTKLRLK